MSSSSRVAARYLAGTSLEALPEDPWRYFNKIHGSLLVPIRDLTPIRARPSGIINAREYMLGAYNGRNKKRDPLSVEPNGDGTYTVKDGNSTYANAVASGWKSIPVLPVSE
mgnify:CR=1 FL=1